MTIAGVDTALLSELVLASRILAHNKVVDGFGHVSVRQPGRHDRFLISRSMAPALVTIGDLMAIDLDGMSCDDDRAPFLERFIHARIYQARADVGAVVHSHSPALIPFAAVPDVPLRPVFHMSSFLGRGAKVFEIREAAGEDSDMLIRDAALGDALAISLGVDAAILMRGHGATVVGASLQQAVFRAIYMEVNAEAQYRALQLGQVVYLNMLEVANASAANDGQVDRAWQVWKRDAEA